MKWIVVLTALIFVPCAWGLTLAWDANSEEDLGGYNLYWGTETGVYDDYVDVGNVTQYDIGFLSPGTYYFVVTAYYADVPGVTNAECISAGDPDACCTGEWTGICDYLESDDSNEVFSIVVATNGVVINGVKF